VHPRRLLILPGYLALVIGITWPLAGSLGAALPGYPNVDATDTVMLRGLVAEALRGGPTIYHPVGLDPLNLTPNLADHLLGAPLAWWLPFPLGDALWWLLALTAVGVAGHHLGRQLGGSHGAGALVGVALLTSEAVAREANLHHAPQVLAAVFAPLYLAALLRAVGVSTRESPRPRDAVMAGVWMSAAALSYWYQGLFLATASLPIALAARRRWRPAARAVGGAAAVTAAICAGPLLWTLGRWSAMPDAGATAAPPGSADGVPAAWRVAFEHGVDPLLALSFTPADRSNGLALALVVAVAAAAWVQRRDDRPAPWPLLWVAAIGAAFLLGPYLKRGEAALTGGGGLITLPFEWLGGLHPALARLTWPERWGLLVPLGLAAFAARAPRPWLFAVALLLEPLGRSQNLPLQQTDLTHERPWAALAAADGAVLELPLSRGWRTGSLPGRHLRWHGRSVVNPVLLPPGVRAPAAWQSWAAASPLVSAALAYEAGESPPPPGPEAAAALRADGVGVVTLDLLTAGVTPARARAYERFLTASLGAPEDRGAMLVWWLTEVEVEAAPMDDPERWRAVTRQRWADAPEPALETLIQPLWPAP